MIKKKHLFLACGGYLALAWAAVITFDVLYLFRADTHSTAIVWDHLFGNGKPVEWGQWSLLSAAGVMAAFFSGKLMDSSDERTRGIAMFWLLMAVAFSMMVLEDAADLRHEVLRIFEGVSGAALNVSILSRAVEFAYFVVLASVPLYALIRFGKYLYSYSAAFNYVMLGFAFYAVAAISSATRYWGGWYGIVGGHIQQSAGFVVPENFELARYHHLLMDSLFEETVEFFGATFFIVAMVAFWQAIAPGHPAREYVTPGTENAIPA